MGSGNRDLKPGTPAFSTNQTHKNQFSNMAAHLNKSFEEIMSKSVKILEIMLKCMLREIIWPKNNVLPVLFLEAIL